MGQRISEWEAKVMRRADAAQTKAAASASADVRAHIQEEIATTKKQRRQAVREQEKARQFDRQREEIHPSSVLETLKTFAPPERESLQVPKARPDSGRTPRRAAPGYSLSEHGGGSMTRSPLPLFDGFIETPFEHRFQGLLQESWRERSWHVIVAEPGSGKTMGICDLQR